MLSTLPNFLWQQKGLTLEISTIVVHRLVTSLDRCSFRPLATIQYHRDDVSACPRCCGSSQEAFAPGQAHAPKVAKLLEKAGKAHAPYEAAKLIHKAGAEAPSPVVGCSSAPALSISNVYIA